MMARLGRPPLDRTPEEAEAARLASVAKSKAKIRNVTVDADLLPELNAMANDLEKTFGFRPTLSQTLRHLILKARK